MNRHPAKVYIIIRGGMLEAVYSDNDQLDAVLLEFDDYGTRSPEELVELKRMYDAVKQSCIEIEYWEAHEL
jgi:hypothetical protein